jgi:predicted site-specific integrase-resolvase
LVERKPFLTRAEMAARYRVSIRTLDRWIREGLLPKIKITERCVRLDPIECDEAVRRFTIQEVTRK